MPLSVRAVVSRSDSRSFINLPFRLRRKQPGWSAPLGGLVYASLNPRRNPYFEHAEAKLFIAEKDGEVVGRILAHIDHNLNDFQKNKWGLFGFFDAENDPVVAKALLEAAEQWLSESGRDKLVGPLEFSINQVPGLLIEGYERAPVAGQPWHPPYYRSLLEGCGLVKAVDTLWRDFDLDQISEEVRNVCARWAAIAESRYGVTIRPIRKSTMRNDFEEYFKLLRATLSSHWGFVPLTEEEISSSVKLEVRAMGMLLAERGDNIIGASILVRDSNSPKIDQGRLAGMLIERECQHLGIAPALFLKHIELASRQGINQLVMGWSLERNEQVNLVAERLGLPVTRRHRIYEKGLASPLGVGPATRQ